MTVGDVLRMRDRITKGYVRFVVTGLYRPRQVSSPYWNLSEIAQSGSSTAGGFTTFGPLTVQPAAFAGGLAVNQGTWLAEPQTASIPADQLTAVAANVNGLRAALQNAQQLPSLTLTTSLPAVLDGTASDLDVARSLLAICAVLLFLLAAAALLAAARLLAGQREGESAMLTARGATRWQLVRLTAAEAIPLCVLAAAAGGVLGVLLARLVAGDRADRRRLAGRRGGRRRGGGDHAGPRAEHGGPGRGPGPPGPAGGHLRGQPGRRGPGPDPARRARGLAAAALLGGLGRRERQLRHRPGGRDRAGPGPGGRHRPRAAPAAGGRQGRRPAGRPRPAADRRAGQLADQPPADPAGRRGAADRAGRGDRDAGAVAAAELDALGS